MKRLSRGVAVLAGLTAALPMQGNILDFLFGRRAIEVITTTEMTPEGRLLRRPTQQEPIYYVPVSLGFQDLGGAVGGEKIPPKDEAIRTIVKTLAEQGYRPLTSRGPAPSLVLVLMWGTLNADMDFGFDPDLPARQVNQQQIFKFLGGYKFGYSDRDFDPMIPSVTGLDYMNYDARELYDISTDDFFVAAVAAYDYQSMMAKKKKLLWVTRISCPSRGYELSEVLPTMLVGAGPNIGRDTPRPVWTRAAKDFKPTVTLGGPKLLEYLDDKRLPVIESTPNKTNDKGQGPKR